MSTTQPLISNGSGRFTLGQKCLSVLEWNNVSQCWRTNSWWGRCGTLPSMLFYLTRCPFAGTWWPMFWAFLSSSRSVFHLAPPSSATAATCLHRHRSFLFLRSPTATAWPSENGWSTWGPTCPPQCFHTGLEVDAGQLLQRGERLALQKSRSPFSSEANRPQTSAMSPLSTGRPSTVCETIGKADIWLMRNFWDIETPRPTLPNFKHVGGLHCKPAGPLPEARVHVPLQSDDWRADGGRTDNVVCSRTWRPSCRVQVKLVSSWWPLAPW